MRNILKFVLSVFFIVTLVGCTKSNQNTSVSTKSIAHKVVNGQEQKIQFALVTSIGGVHDQSFNQSTWEGLMSLNKKYNVNITYIETQKHNDMLNNLQIFSNQHKDIIFCTGYSFAQPLAQAAQDYPQQKFVVVDYSMPQGKYSNVMSVEFKSAQASFLAGYLAAMKTKTGIVGFLGGIHTPIIDHFQYGYEAGVAYGRSLLHKKITVYNQDIGSFTDLAKDKSAAKTMYDKGADIIFSAAGAAGNGAIVAAQEKNTWVIGVDQDQSYLAPKHVLTSVLKKINLAVFNIGQRYIKNHEFHGGQTLVLGLKQNAVGLVMSHFITLKEKQNLQTVKYKIIKGSIKVPSDKKSYDLFIQKLEKRQ